MTDVKTDIPIQWNPQFIHAISKAPGIEWIYSYAVYYWVNSFL